MYIRSGEWVIILKAKILEKSKIFKSLRLGIIVLLMLVSSIPCFIVKSVIINSYEKRSVEWRMAEIQEQCAILSNQLSNSFEEDHVISEEVDAELNTKKASNGYLS